MPEKLADEAAALIHASLAKGTWEKYASGWKAFDSFQAYIGKQYKWPLPLEAYRGFATYLVRVRGLKTSSTKSYISSLSCLHKLKGVPNHKMEDELLQSIIRGAENIQMSAPIKKPNNRRAMTVALLRHLGNRLAKSGWAKPAKQCVWTAGLTAFFGTTRMGELLSDSETSCDPTSSFTWSCIKYRPKSDSFLLHVKLAKTRSPEGEFIDIFPFKKLRGLCPVAALKKHHALQKAIGRGRPEDPVFVYPSGNFLTTEAFNKAIRILLKDVVDFKKDTISCHSFRAGLPSLIAQHPEIMSSEDVKNWGRWSSEAYARYTRLKLSQKLAIFNQIASIIN